MRVLIEEALRDAVAPHSTSTRGALAGGRGLIGGRKTRVTRSERDVKVWREACTIQRLPAAPWGGPMQARFIRPIIGAVLSVTLLTPACASAQGWPGRNGPGWAGQSGSRAGFTAWFRARLPRGAARGRAGRPAAPPVRPPPARRLQRRRPRLQPQSRRSRPLPRRVPPRVRERLPRRVRARARRGQHPRARPWAVRRSRRGVYNEPAYARGYAEGFDKGREDWEDRDRYDPVRHREYRDGDRGYNDNYGSRDLYKQNYREGFREGYEDGYRGGNRDFRR